MTRLIQSTMIFVVGLSLTGCSWLIGEWAGQERGETDRLTFSHKKHIIDEEVECSDCHGEMLESVSLQQRRQMPKEAACMECHDRVDDCSKCHANPRAPLRWLDHRMTGIRFSHKAHLSRKSTTGGKASRQKLSCTTCHADIAKATRVSTSKRPQMFKVCGTCHAQDFDRSRCLRCHTDLVDNTEQPLTLFSHTGDWLRRHGTAAKGASLVCAHCHTDSSCTDCHARTNARIARPSLLQPTAVGRRTHHRGDWMTRHRVESRLNPSSCLTCHQQRSCTDCHTARQVGANSPGGASRHPLGWMVRGSARFHGAEARRAPLACASCHDRGAASNCVTCHRVGGSGGNPHPPGWRSDQNKNRAPACAPCHN